MIYIFRPKKIIKKYFCMFDMQLWPCYCVFKVVFEIMFFFYNYSSHNVSKWNKTEKANEHSCNAFAIQYDTLWGSILINGNVIAVALFNLISFNYIYPSIQINEDTFHDSITTTIISCKVKLFTIPLTLH